MNEKYSMRLPFYKYQATGNDFVIINQMQVPYLKNPDADTVAKLCDRRFGVGADGLMLLEACDEADFKMVYYNADGNLSTMCGNGGRAITHLAHHLKVFREECTFLAADGLHDAVVGENVVSLKMGDVFDVQSRGADFVLDTGSPHFVSIREGVADMDVYAEARSIRYNDEFSANGINVNFVETTSGGLLVRTYERGVEDETYSCGTGVTAAALVASQTMKEYEGENEINILTKGGRLKVKWCKTDQGFEDIWLTGPAVKVYEGVFDLTE